MLKIMVPLVVVFSTNVLQAQDCKNCYYFSSSKIEMTKYDASNTANGKDVYTISGVQQQGNTATAHVQVIKYDKDGKETEKSSGEVKCTNGDVFTGFMVPDMEKITTTPAPPPYLSYPAAMQQGQVLNDKVEFAFKGESKGKKVNISLEILNRRVTGKEKVTTAGSAWECFVIEYDFNMRIKVAGISIPAKAKVREWYARGVGVIKTVAIDKDGKIQETSLLTRK